MLYSSSGNSIYHNNVKAYLTEAHDDSPIGNQWDNGYPSGGNYWDSYSDVDQYSGPNQDQPGADGIGDSPKAITGGANKDRYPLVQRFNPPPATPSSPRNLQASAVDQNITLTWDPSLFDGGFPIINYSIYRGVFPGTEIFLLEIGNMTAYNDTGVTGGTRYYYQVAARNAMGEGPRSRWAN